MPTTPRTAPAPNHKALFIDAVTRGDGFMPWQPHDRAGDSPAEQQLRAALERRKDRILAGRVPVRHPAMLTPAMLDRARAHIRSADWARAWYEETVAVADHVAGQDAAYLERMIPALSPTNPYGFSCPRCVGKKSAEGVGCTGFAWDYRRPEVITCKYCGQTLPDAAFPETGVLQCPRAGHSFTYYVNPAQRRHPRDRSGKYAWKWVWKPAHVSFAGTVREQKILFMTRAVYKLALAHRFTGKPRYARWAVDILVRLAQCCRGWLYHDFYGTIADCDPLFAAYNDTTLPLLWKRNAAGMAYGGTEYETGPVDDQPDRAKMLATYFGCGRITPSADCWVLETICPAYDLVHDVKDAAGRPLWTPETRTLVERDLILEYLLGAEPYLGGPGKATCINNKAPYVYAPMALAARCLGMPNFADVALKGYETIIHHSFVADGFSKETPAYTDMFLNRLLWIPEWLHGFKRPRKRRGAKPINVYRDDPRLARMMATLLEFNRASGKYIPLSDTPTNSAPSPHLFEIGVKRCPRRFAGTLPAIYRAQVGYNDRLAKPSEYALFHLTPGEVKLDRGLPTPDTFFPAWMTALLHDAPEKPATAKKPATSSRASVLAMPLNPPGIHRHMDNLGLYYEDRGQPILGEQGYVCDTPQIAWAHATASHNLVLVDDADQLFWAKFFDAPGTPGARNPSLRLMASSPHVSVVEGESQVYPQCSRYRRLAALIKGPHAQTFVIDIFRVTGGNKHAYRLFSELASSDAGSKGRRRFVGIDMPKEPPLPEFGSSVAEEHVAGLRDVTVAIPTSACWQAIWEEPGRAYRLWMFSPADRVEASNGPGQETYAQIGRRVRFLDVVREGRDVSSTFVAIHEPSGVDGRLPILAAERLATPPQAGPGAIALRIRSHWGDFLILAAFDGEAKVAGIRFQGAFAVVGQPPRGKHWTFSCAPETLAGDGWGFEGRPAVWEGTVRKIRTKPDTSGGSFVPSTPRPVGWPVPQPGVTAHVLLDIPAANSFTGYPVASTTPSLIRTARFPLHRARRFSLPAVRLL